MHCLSRVQAPRESPSLRSSRGASPKAAVRSRMHLYAAMHLCNAWRNEGRGCKVLTCAFAIILDISRVPFPRFSKERQAFAERVPDPAVAPNERVSVFADAHGKSRDILQASSRDEVERDILQFTRHACRVRCFQLSFFARCTAHMENVISSAFVPQIHLFDSCHYRVLRFYIRVLPREIPPLHVGPLSRKEVALDTRVSDVARRVV